MFLVNVLINKGCMWAVTLFTPGLIVLPTSFSSELAALIDTSKLLQTLELLNDSHPEVF